MSSPSSSDEAQHNANPSHDYIYQALDWLWNLSPLEKFTLAYVIFTAIYAVITIKLYCVTKQSADANVTAVRAWVYPSDIIPPSPAQIHVGAKFPVRFENGGKTPATEIVVTEEFKYWARSSGVPMPEFDHCESGDHYSVQTGSYKRRQVDGMDRFADRTTASHAGSVGAIGDPQRGALGSHLHSIPNRYRPSWPDRLLCCRVWS